MASTSPRRYPSLIGNENYSMGIGSTFSPSLMHPAQKYGPYAYENWLFCVCVYDSGASRYITIFRSVDAGLTWVESDTANRKITAPTTSVSGYSLISPCRHGHLLFIAHNNVVRVDQFDMNLNTWGTVIATGGPAVLDSGASGKARLFLEYRTDGSFVLMYTDQQNVGGTNYGRVKYVTLTGSTWSGVGSITAHAGADAINDRPLGIVRGASNRVHLFFGSSQGGSGMALFHVSLSSAGSLDTYTQLGGLAKYQSSSSDDSHHVVGPPIYTNSKVFIPFLYLDGVDSYVKVASGDSQADPVFTNETPPYMNDAIADNHDYCPSRRAGSILSLSSGSTSIGIFHISSSNGESSIRYTDLPIVNGDSNEVHLFAVVGTVSEGNDGRTLYVHSTRTTDGTWGNPEEVLSDYWVYCVYTAPAKYCITSSSGEACTVIY